MGSLNAENQHADNQHAVNQQSDGYRDEVDRLIAAWKRERPDADLAPLAILSRITRISRHLDLARKDAFAELETWDSMFWRRFVVPDHRTR